MRILFWHGYLLGGTGSNIYTTNVAKVWRDQGHDVLLMCQDRNAATHSFVDAVGEFSSDNRSFSVNETGKPGAAGSVTVVRPDLAGLLPVYVYDEYAGFTVKTFLDLTEAELASYVDRNVVALATAIEQYRPDAIFVGHEIMGPAIALRACAATNTQYVALAHGSPLVFTIGMQARYAEHAREGLNGAAAVVAPSAATMRTMQAMAGPISTQLRIVNPGADVDLFIPKVREDQAAPTVGFVGKFIAYKGPQNLLAALGLTQTPDLRAQLVGFGGFEAGLHQLDAALNLGDVETVATLAKEGDGTAPLNQLASFIEQGHWNGITSKRYRQVDVGWLGRQEHDQLSVTLPNWDVLAVPTIGDEAFGMVAAEAAAAGVLPIVPAHSGIMEVGLAVESALDTPTLFTYDPSYPIEGMARCIDSIFALPEQQRREMRETVVRLARERWSWQAVAAQNLRIATSV